VTVAGQTSVRRAVLSPTGVPVTPTVAMVVSSRLARGTPLEAGLDFQEGVLSSAP